MTNAKQITDAQIETLRAESFYHGDAVQGYICRVAQGEEFNAEDLADESCLSPDEQRRIRNMLRDEAIEICAACIRNADADADACACDGGGEFGYVIRTR